MQPQPHSTTTFLVTAVIIVLVMGLRMTRARTARPLNMRTWWLWPAFFALLIGGGVVAMLTTAHVELDATAIIVLIASLIAGSFAGWWRGRFMTIEIDAATRKPMVKASGAALLVLGGLVVARTAAKMLFLGDADPQSPETMRLNADFALFGLGVLAVARVEMWLRARRLLSTTPPTP